MPKQPLRSLEERMDAQLHAFAYAPAMEEEERTSAPRMAARGVAAGALGAGMVAGASFKNRAAISAAGKDVARKGLKKTASVAGQASNQLHRSALKSGGMKMRAAGAGSNILQKASTGLRKVAKSFQGVDQIVHLAQRIAALEMEHEFGDEEKQRSKFGVAAMGGPVALKSQQKFKDAGHVYRKRDAYVDQVKGVLGGTGLAYGTAGAGVLGSHALIKAAKSGKIPKGMLRKGAVKTAQVLKKAGRHKGVALGGLAATIAGSQIAANRLQGKSADKRLAKRQAQA